MARFCFPFWLLLSALLVVPPAARGAVIITTIGTPVFQVVDTHLYAAPTDLPSFAGLFPKHFPTRLVHAPPYDQEFADGLALTGYPEKTDFSVQDFISPNAVHFGFVLVPGSNAPTGSSFDFASDRIIPNSILPIAIQGDVYLNGAPYELNAFGLSLTPQAGFDGRSHFLVDIWENSLFAPPGLGSFAGNYEYRLTMRDEGGSGFNVVAQFRIVPEPGTLVTQFGLFGAMVFASYVWRRPRRTGN